MSAVDNGMLAVEARANINAAIAVGRPVLVSYDLTDQLPPGAVFARTGTAPWYSPSGYTTASANTPRFETIGGVKMGLCFERQRISVYQDQTFSSIAGVTRATGISDGRGGTTAQRFTTAGVGSHLIVAGGNTMAVGNNEITSWKVKPVSGNGRFQISGASGGFGTGPYVNFGLLESGGPRVLLANEVPACGIIALPDGWFIIWATMIATGTVDGSNLCAIEFLSSGRIPNSSDAAVFDVDWAQDETTTIFGLLGPTSYTTSSRAAESLTLPAAVADGTYQVRYTFFDGNYQDVSTAIAAGAFSVPLTLAQRWIKRVSIMPLGTVIGGKDSSARDSTITTSIRDTTTTPAQRMRVAVVAQNPNFSPLCVDSGKLIGLSYIGQSNAVSSGTGNATDWSTARFPHQVFSFDRTGGRANNGDPTQGGGRVYASQMQRLEATSSDSTFASFPMISSAFVGCYKARYQGNVPPSYLVCADALGGVPITYLRKGADSGGTPKYFYVNAVDTRKAMLAAAEAYSLDLDYRIVFVQGEDTTIPTDLYQTYLSDDVIDAHLTDSVTDIGKRPTSFVVLQTNGLTDGSNDQRAGPLAHLAETRRRRGSSVVLAGPMYQFPISNDTIHSSETGRQMQADLINAVHDEIERIGSFTPLDIARTSTPALGANQGIRSTGLSAGTQITGLGTGVGGTGTYTVNNSQTVTSRRMVAFGAVFTGSISGTTLTVTAIHDGALDVAINSATVTIRMNRPVKIDTDWVPSVGAAYGLEWSDASSRTISSVIVTHDIVTMTLSGAPSGAKSLGFAVSNCDPSYYKTGLGSESNWSATRGQLYADSGVEALAYVVSGRGPRTVRHYLPRFIETW